MSRREEHEDDCHNRTHIRLDDALDLLRQWRDGALSDDASALGELVAETTELLGDDS